MRFPRKLTEVQVRAIRFFYARAYKSSNQLAREYGVSTATVFQIVQGSTYKSAGGLITWPNGQHYRQLPRGVKVRGQCREEMCHAPIASSNGWAQRMHLCERCFRIGGGKKGRPKLGKTITITCRVCREKFTRYVRPSEKRPRYCSRLCCDAVASERHRKRPLELTDDRLRELYVEQNMTAKEIADKFGNVFTKHAVQLWVIAAKIPRRTHRTYSVCVADGCTAAVYKLFNGIRWYGRLCKEHLREREKARTQARDAALIERTGDALAREIHQLLAGLPDAVRLDAESEIMLAVLSRSLPLPLSAASVKPFIARSFKENANAYDFVSINAPVRQGDDVQTWGERLGLS